jgi:ferredoxin-NADP reductase/MOSC domain-containing protein YiiM/predicted pyridoxine 5'-phosphate oxidase superfamily flavin-nucleotide-binding protein
MGGNDSPFHRGEKAMQSRLGGEDRVEQLGRRMIQPRMAETQQAFFAQLSTLLVGTADTSGRPWASVLAGQPGFLRPIDDITLRVQAQPLYGDPLQAALVDGGQIGTLGLHFPTRTRVRLNGTIANVAEDGFNVRVAQAFGNCDMYIQTRELKLVRELSTIREKRPVRRGEALNKAEAELIARSDTLFIATQATGTGERTDGIDLSHRGDCPGSVIVAHESALLFPDYPGNCMFNTLGNLYVDPRAGLLFIDFESGDTLQVTGEAEVLWEPHHVNRFPGAERVVSFRVEETLYVERALPFKWTFGDYSPVLENFAVPELEPPPTDALPEMKLVSINLSMPTEVVHEDKTVSTGIFKRPAEGRVRLRRLNLEGDGQADLWGHGGAFRALYVYPHEHYDYWRAELGRDDFELGQFGENFTVEGMLEEGVRVGDVFRIGGALVEVSQPRIPCFKLAIKMGIENFQNPFLKSGRVGFYFRVLQEGDVGAGDTVELVGRDPNGMSVRAVSDLLFFNVDDLDGTRQALSIRALSHGWKGSFEERLVKVGQAAAPRKGLREFVVKRKLAESETITSFYLEPADGEPLASYQAGQFLTFELTIPDCGSRVMRTYSLSDSPDREYYRVSIKREPAPRDKPEAPPGLSSNYFHDHVDEGTSLQVGAPRGKFQLDGDSDRTLVMLSAGVGLTPLLSMLNTVVRSGSNRRVWFIHGARNGREHAFGDHVRRLAAEHDNVSVHIRYSAPQPGDVEGRDYDSLGHIDVDLLKRLLPFDDYEFYLVGPTPFMRSLYGGLTSAGVAESRIHYEFFGPASALNEEAESRGQAPGKDAKDELDGACEVTFARSGVNTRWHADCESILDLAEHNGLSLPYSCRSGICRTCMCELTEGEIEYIEEPLNAPDEGSVLICIARPKSRVVIDV